MKYVSLVGTQVMAVLNPLLALVVAGKKPERIGLFHTFKTLAHAEKIEKFLVDSKHYTKDEICVKLISITLEDDKHGNPSPQKAVAEFSSPSNSYFNIAGGLNYQIAACVAEMDEECHLLYPESAGIHYFKCNRRAVEKDELFKLPSPVDVISLQGVPVNSGNISWSEPALLKSIRSARNISLPKSSKENVVIDGVDFDYIYNIGNELRFLKVVDKKSLEGKDRKTISRELNTLALDRERFGELFHRSIILVTDDSHLAERVRNEGGGKVNVVKVKYVYTGNKRTDKPDLGTCEKLNKYLTTPVSAKATLKIKAIKNMEAGSNDNGDATLYAMLGREILPTLISIWTHRPKSLVLLYTPEDIEVDSYRKAIYDNKTLLPVKQISLLSISLTGKDILTNADMANGAEAEVNITPGTKSQAAFLAMWAKTNNAKIYSLLNGQKKAVEIGGNSEHRMSAPDPLKLLKLSSIPIQSEGQDNHSLMRENKKYEAMLSKGNYPNKRDGSWFEGLIGYCLYKCGADDVRIGIRTEWSEETQKVLENKHSGSFMTDIDVAARLVSTYYVVECKAISIKKGERPKKDDVKKAALQAQAGASLFGRFAVPLVAFLQYDGDPYKENDLYVFGDKTFTDSGALKNLLNTAVRERSKTQPDE